MRHRFHPAFGPGFLSLLCALLLSGLALAARPSRTARLTPQNRLAIVRELAYEYVTVQQPLPASPKVEQAVALTEGKLDEEQIGQLLANHGAAVRAGEIVQITAIEFERDYILFEINGGGKKKKKKWWQRIQIQGGMAGSPEASGPPRSPTPPRPPGAEPGRVGAGTWIKLSFPHLLPDVTPDEVKEMLATVLAFTEGSPAERWIDTIDPKFKQAIEEQRAIPGMNRKMVLAAMGRPQSKVRETKNGVETEDWIYGYPPMVTFVTFVGDEVIEVREFK